MVNFFSAFLSQPYLDAQKGMLPEFERAAQSIKDQAQSEGRPIPWGEIQRLRRSYGDRIPRPPFSILIDHIDHIARTGGVDHVGLGSDFDGIDSQLPEGIDSPADLPKITAALMDRGYTPDDCHKILGGNLLRVFREVDEVSQEF